MKAHTTLMTGAALASVLVSLAIPAHAAETATDPLGALTEVSANADSLTTNVLSNVAKVSTDENGSAAINATVAGVDVTVPTDPTAPISLASEGGPGIEISMPFADQADDAKVIKDGVVSYDNRNGSATVPVVKKDGSLQITTVIENASAPSAYAYPLELPAGATALPQADGGVLFLSADGSYLGGVAPAWAKDADDVSLATHYEIEGSTLTQVVDHSGANVAYPVVADPWMGNQLISYTSWSGNTLRVYPTDYGRWGASAARSVAWDEVKAKTPGTRENTSSMTDQFLCHYDARPATSWKSSWNLDLNRPYVNYAWLLANGCNV